MNIFPYNNGHLMIAPYKHTPSLQNLSEEELLEMMKLVVESEKALKALLSPDGFNIGLNIGRVAGAGFEEHVHIHIVPRFNGDTNFMPIVANTKVISESLMETYKKLKGVWPS
jgi:ATP adenylyltransferase